MIKKYKASKPLKTVFINKQIIKKLFETIMSCKDYFVILEKSVSVHIMPWHIQEKKIMYLL